MNLLALDLSLSSTGWCAGPLVPLRGEWRPEAGTLRPSTGNDRGVRRLQWIRDAVLAYALHADFVVLEGYSYASRNQAHQLGELGGVVRCALADAGIPFADVAPSSRCLFATGKGNASKEQVLAEAIRLLDYRGHSHDEADALWLMQMARAHYESRGDYEAYKDLLNQARRKALAAVAWPTLTPAAGA